MDTNNRENGNNAKNLWNLLVGLLAGGLGGAVAMLLLAPQSGKETRTQIQQKSIGLRDRTVKTVQDATGQVRSKAHQITDSVREQVEELQQRGQDAIDGQRDHLAKTLKGLGEAVQA